MRSSLDEAHALDHVDGLSVLIDELGRFAELTIHDSVYDRVAVYKTAYWFTDRHYVFLRPHDKGLVVELRLKRPMATPGDVAAVAGDFANRLLDQQVRQQVLAETAEVRDGLIQKAFFEGRKRRLVNSQALGV